MKKTLRETLEQVKYMTPIIIYSQNGVVDVKLQWEVDNEWVLSDKLLDKKVDYISAHEDRLMICVLLEEEQEETE